jgi:hypothetical protein
MNRLIHSGYKIRSLKKILPDLYGYLATRSSGLGGRAWPLRPTRSTYLTDFINHFYKLVLKLIK